MTAISFLPTLNATLNALAGILLFIGWRFIKQRKEERHKRFMLSALTCSAFFLCSYVTYHYLRHGVVTHYQRQGILRVIYFTILLTHTPLAALIVPFSIAAAWTGHKRNLSTHVKITRWLFPTWMYVSVTGVLIYLMLYIF